jgi:hypothetical protein
MTPSVFDIDGCLADTLPLVRECYEAAGADGVTLDDVRKHWRFWLPDLVGGEVNAESVRRRKTDLYLSRLHEGVRSLPAAKLARELLDSGEDQVWAVTAGAASPSRRVLQVIGLADIRVLGSEVIPDRRPEALTSLAPRGTYYDDDEMTCWYVHAETEWAAIPV